jgi:tetratricopeptide (TPR) repeat protein
MMDREDIKKRMEEIPTAGQKINYLERLHKIHRDHCILFYLARLYFDSGEPDRSEALLKEDLKNTSCLEHAYESYSLLIGLYIDQGRRIPEKEIERYYRFFFKLKKSSAQNRNAPNGAVSYGKDPFQFERMLGDYYYEQKIYEKASEFYKSFYSDMDKPPEIFSPASMRNYIDILLRVKKSDEAIYFLGYVVNLKPYMLDDIHFMADLYKKTGNLANAVLMLLFAYTLSDGYGNAERRKCRNRIEKIIDHIKELQDTGPVEKLTVLFLAGGPMQKIRHFVEELKAQGIQHFFFSYLEGISFFEEGDYAAALSRLLDFCDVYPYLADAYYFALISMYALDAVEYHDRIVAFSEKTIELKPRSPLAKGTKRYLGRVIGLEDDECEKLLIPSEIGTILNGFIFHGTKVSTLDPLIASLTISKNPYQDALIGLLSKMKRRKEEFFSYLEHVYDLMNEKGKENIGRLLNTCCESYEQC